MKTKYILSAVIIPCVILLAAFKQGGHGHGNDGEKHHSEENNDQGNGKHQSEENDNSDNEDGNDKYKNQDNKHNHQDGEDNNSYNDGREFKHQKQINKFHKNKNDNHYGKNDDENGLNSGNNDNWDDNKWDDNRFEARMQQLKSVNRKNWVNRKYYPGIVWFDPNTNDYRNIKQPKEYKKVTLCHIPKGSKFPVTISVSENAVKAHLNHGDYLGECNDFDRSRYSDNYWNARKEYYNQYNNTTETLSYGEQLLALAVAKLTKAKAQITPLKSTLQQEELKRKESALIKLQNDVYNLQNSLSKSNKQVGLQVNYKFQ
jgi:hypothetical protein